MCVLLGENEILKQLCKKKFGHAFTSVHIFWDIYLLQLKIIDNEDQSTLKTKSGEFMFLPAVTLGPVQRQGI